MTAAARSKDMDISSKNSVTFPGGAHPPQKKDLTCDSSIHTASPVKQVSVMLSQHIGTAGNALVKRGDAVQAGQKIGDCDAFVSSPVHSPVNGKVKDVTLQSHAVLGRSLAVIIEADTQNNPLKQPVAGKFSGGFNEARFAPEQICEAVRQAGIVGMGGAGFPTRVKIEPNPKMPKDTLIVNGCECEPYITCDYRVMLEWTDQVIAGVKLARRASGCSRCIIAIEDNKPKAIEAVRVALKNTPCGNEIEVIAVKTKYPQGGERQLTKAVLGKNVPTGGIPPMIGVLVINVATAAAIAEAVVCGNPLTHRVVTVTGDAISRPANIYAPIGTPVEELIGFCGGVTKKSAKVILGGPMMGIAIADLKTATTKTTGAVTILTGDEIGSAKFARRQTPCIRCGRCLEVCPENLIPTKIAHAVNSNDFELAKDHYIAACMECGCCSYVCPANIELTGLIKAGKMHLARQAKKVPQ